MTSAKARHTAAEAALLRQRERFCRQLSAAQAFMLATASDHLAPKMQASAIGDATAALNQAEHSIRNRNPGLLPSSLMLSVPDSC